VDGAGVGHGQRRRSVTVRVACVVAALVVVAAGCGGGGDDVSDIELDPRPSATSATSATTPPSPSSAPTAATTAIPGTSMEAPATAAPATTAPSADGSWQPASANLTGLSSECGNVGLASQPESGLFVAGVARQGLFTVAPGATAWTPLGAGGDEITNRVQQVLGDPADPSTFWEAGIYGDGRGVFRTDDGGASFTSLGAPGNTDFVSVDFTDPQRRTLLLGAHEQSVLRMSTDGGASWREVGGLPPDLGYASAPLVVDSRTFLLGTFNGAEADGIFRSADGGSTWDRVFDGGVVGVPLARGTSIHWLAESGGGLVTSDDGGATWRLEPADVLSPLTNQLLAMADGSIVAVGRTSLVATTDAGATWRDVGPPLPYEPNHVAWSSAEQTYYVSRFVCSFEDDNPVAPDAIMRLTPG